MNGIVSGGGLVIIVLMSKGAYLIFILFRISGRIVLTVLRSKGAYSIFI